MLKIVFFFFFSSFFFFNQAAVKGNWLEFEWSRNWCRVSKFALICVLIGGESVKSLFFINLEYSKTVDCEKLLENFMESYVR